MMADQTTTAAIMDSKAAWVIMMALVVIQGIQVHQPCATTTNSTSQISSTAGHHPPYSYHSSWLMLMPIIVLEIYWRIYTLI